MVGGGRAGRVAGQGKEGLVQAGLAESDLGDTHPGLGEPSHGMPDQPAHVCRAGRRGEQHGQGERVGGEMDRPLQGGGEDLPRSRTLLAVEEPDVQGARSDPGLELGTGAFGHDPAVVDDRDLVGELVGLIRRGQRTGDFDPSPPAAWLAAAIIGLQHAAAAEVAAGRLTARKAAALCLESTLRLCGAADARCQPMSR